MVYLKLLVASMYFESCKAEEMLSMIMIQSADQSDYQTFVTKKPLMKPSYVEKLQKEWDDMQEIEVEL